MFSLLLSVLLDNKADMISRFIKHFSPFCKHCTELAPIWIDLAVGKTREYSGRLKFGEIDCVAYGDLCTDNGIEAYPALQW